MDRLVTGRVTRAPSFEAYWAQRPAELRDGLARRRRRLSQQGVAERLSLLRDPGDVAFDESRRRDAPGYLLQAQLIRQMHQDAALDSIEFFGPATPGWTHKWTPDLRALHHLNVYRHPALRQAAQWRRALRQAPRVQVDPPAPAQP